MQLCCPSESSLVTGLAVLYMLIVGVLIHYALSQLARLLSPEYPLVLCVKGGEDGHVVQIRAHAVTNMRVGLPC